MLLRNRSRAVTKPGLMADHRQNHAAPIPSLFGCPKLRELSTKCVFGSGLEGFCSLRSRSRPFKYLLSLSPVGFWHKPQAIPISSPSPNNTHYSKGGIGIGNALLDNPNVLFGTQLLRVKIPNSSPSSKEYCQTTCVDYWSEMECCVKSHGPNPTTTHIFHNFIVVDTSHHHNNTYSSFPLYSQFSTNFLTLCYTCNMHLDHSKDIFIYRGEKAFCSEECRYREMVSDTEQETSDFHNNHPHPSLSHMDHKSLASSA